MAVTNIYGHRHFFNMAENIIIVKILGNTIVIRKKKIMTDFAIKHTDFAISKKSEYIMIEYK